MVCLQAKSMDKITKLKIWNKSSKLSMHADGCDHMEFLWFLKGTECGAVCGLSYNFELKCSCALISSRWFKCTLISHLLSGGGEGNQISIFIENILIKKVSYFSRNIIIEMFLSFKMTDSEQKKDFYWTLPTFYIIK